MELLGEHSSVIFHPRKAVPEGYVAVTKQKSRKIVFTMCMRYCSQRTKNTVVFFHGNGELVEDYTDSEIAKEITKSLNLCFVEYRGYGFFTEYQVNVVKMMEDVSLVQHTLKRTFGISTENTIVMGRSIGSLFAAEYCKRFPDLAGVIIESGFSNSTPFYIKRMKMQNPEVEDSVLEELTQAGNTVLNNAEKMRNYAGPVLIYHGVDDHLVNVEYGKQLYEACESPKKELCLFQIGRHNVRTWNKEEYYHRFHKFTASIFPPQDHHNMAREKSTGMLWKKSMLVVISASIIVALYLSI